jgi:hypothetical protein
MRIKPMMSNLRSCAKRSGVFEVLRFLDRLADRRDPVPLALLLVDRFDDREPLFLRDEVDDFLFATVKPPRGAIIAYE